MGRFRANMHHGKGNSDASGCLSALFLYGLGDAMGNGCSSLGCTMWFIILCPLFFIFYLVRGDTFGSWFFGVMTAIILIIVVVTVASIVHEKRKSKRQKAEIDDQVIDLHIDGNIFEEDDEYLPEHLRTRKRKRSEE